MTSMILSLLAASTFAEKPRNPILWADVPDLSIVRVGKAYYMSSTTMHMVPGVPIMKSTDLVNWKLVSYAGGSLGDADDLSLRNGKNYYSRGTWASTIRYHKGRFYVSTFALNTGKTYVYSTKDPEKEPWKAITFSPVLYDHSLFFDDDGRVYMVNGNGNIRLTELKEDLTGVKPGGFDQVIIPNATAVAGGQPGLPAEGNQMFKVNGKYYLCNIAWPRGGMRTEIVHRADKITGPYEGRIMFRDQGVAQGGMIDTPDGRWFAYLFQDHGAVGRIPFLVPMTWSNDGWPVVGVNGKLPENLDLPEAKLGTSAIVASDEFKSKKLALAWQWNHNPVDEDWSLSARSGYLRLKTSRTDTELVEARNTITQRTFGPQSRATTKLDVRGMKEGDVAGLCALQKKYGFVGVRVTNGQKSIVMTSAQNDRPVEIASEPLKSDEVYLRIECDFRNLADKATFFYSADGKDWKPIGNTLAMKYDMPHFMGYRFGLFNFATQNPGGHADFDYFRIGPTDASTR